MGYSELGHRWCERCGDLYKKDTKYSKICPNCRINPNHKNNAGFTVAAHKLSKLIKMAGPMSLFDDD